MKISEPALFEILADGQFHSGQQLAERMGVSRTAVWKHLGSLRDKGVAVESVKGRGYRFIAPVEMLAGDRIRRALVPSVSKSLRRLDVCYQLDSTSQYLANRLMATPIHGNVVLAEYQSNGRGRGTHEWLAAPAAGLCMSIGWHFESVPKSLPALSLATGVVLANCLSAFGPQPIRLKWPNDLLHAGAKLGGILIESRGQHAGEVDVIIGIGINVEMPAALAGRINQNVTDLVRIFGHRPSRNQLAGSIINGMFRLLENYAIEGFGPYLESWRALDIGRGRQAVLHRSAGDVHGRVVDIDENGFLVMETEGVSSRYSSGDLSLRVKL